MGPAHRGSVVRRFRPVRHANPERARWRPRGPTKAASDFASLRVAQPSVCSLAFPLDNQCKDRYSQEHQQQWQPDHGVPSHPAAAPCTVVHHVPGLGCCCASGQQCKDTKRRDRECLHQSSRAKQPGDKSVAGLTTEARIRGLLRRQTLMSCTKPVMSTPAVIRTCTLAAHSAARLDGTHGLVVRVDAKWKRGRLRDDCQCASEHSGWFFLSRASW